MKEFDLEPNISWLFIFAHPDDELAIAAWIRRLTALGAAVTLAWLHAIGGREEEAKHAAKTLGAGTEECYFGDFADGSFIQHYAEIKTEVQSCVERSKPDRIVCAAYEQGHLDHDCLRLAIDQVWDGPVLEFPEYWPYTPRVATMNRFTSTEGECVLKLSSEEQRWKLAMAKCYPSTDIWRNLFWYEVWSALKFRRAHLIRTERLRWSPKHDFHQPNVPVKFKSKVLKSKQWSEWTSLLAQIESPD